MRATLTTVVEIHEIVVERVVHELVEQEHAVDAPMLPLDRVLHAVEYVKEIWNLVDVQVVLVVAVLEQLCS